MRTEDIRRSMLENAIEAIEDTMDCLEKKHNSCPRSDAEKEMFDIRMNTLNNLLVELRLQFDEVVR